MQEVLSGFAVVWVIIGVGMLVGRTGILGAEGRQVLSRTAFFVGSPALLFTTLATADVASVLGPQLGVAVLSALACAAVHMSASRLLFPHRAGSERIMHGLSASMVNSANLGLPIAAYVFGDAALAAPVILFQLALYTPLYITVLEATLSAEAARAAGAGRDAHGLRGDGVGGVTGPSAFSRRRRVLRQLLQTGRNPLIVGSMAGLLFSLTGWGVPQPLWDSIELIGGLSIPAMLMAFGMSLVGSRPLRRADGRLPDTLLAAGCKLVLHPLLAWAIAAGLFSLSGPDLLIAVVLGSLPTAQNVYVAAVRYETGEIVAKDAALLTTVLAIPVMVAAAALLA